MLYFIMAEETNKEIQSYSIFRKTVHCLRNCTTDKFD